MQAKRDVLSKFILLTYGDIFMHSRGLLSVLVVVEVDVVLVVIMVVAVVVSGDGGSSNSIN